MGVSEVNVCRVAVLHLCLFSFLGSRTIFSDLLTYYVGVFHYENADDSVTLT